MSQTFSLQQLDFGLGKGAPGKSTEKIVPLTAREMAAVDASELLEECGEYKDVRSVWLACTATNPPLAFKD